MQTLSFYYWLDPINWLYVGARMTSFYLLHFWQPPLFALIWEIEYKKIIRKSFLACYFPRWFTGFFAGKISLPTSKADLLLNRRLNLFTARYLTFTYKNLLLHRCLLILFTENMLWKKFHVVFLANIFQTNIAWLVCLVL